MKLPKHIEFSLRHNPQAVNSETVAEYCEFVDVDDEDWVSLEEKAKAYSTNEMWYAQWYPNTMVGFNCLAASSLEALLAALAKEE